MASVKPGTFSLHKAWETLTQGMGPELLQGLFRPETVYLYLFLVALGLCCCAQVFSNRGKQGLLFVAVLRLLIALAPLVEEHSSRERTQEWHAGLVAPWRVGSASPKDQTHSSCIGKQTPNYWTSRESTGLKI